MEVEDELKNRKKSMVYHRTEENGITLNQCVVNEKSTKLTKHCLFQNWPTVSITLAFRLEDCPSKSVAHLRLFYSKELFNLTVH